MKNLTLALSCCVFVAACEPNLNTNKATPLATVTAASLQALPAGVKNGSGRLSLGDFTKILAVWDESIQAQALEVAIAQQEAEGALGQFEATFYAEYNRAREFSQTTAADFLSTGTGTGTTGIPNPFSEINTSTKVGLIYKDRLGVTMDLFYEMGAISNSLQASAALPSPEKSGEIGFSIKAPLAKNAGEAVNTASVVVAELDKDIAEETVRLLKAQRTFEGIKTYLFVQRAQQRVHLRQITANHSARLLEELREQYDLGLITQSALTQAQADLSQRRASVTLARQELNEQIGALQIFLLPLNDQLPARRWLPSSNLSVASANRRNITLDRALANRPETRINALRIERQEVLSLVAENQTLPEANLVLDFKKTRLSGNYIPFRSIFTSSNPYERWRIGFEYRRGLEGNLAETAAYKAALLREKQAGLTMQAYRQRVASELNGIGSIIARANENLRFQNEIIAAQHALLRTERANADEGSSSGLDVLRAQVTLSLAQEARADAIAQLNLSSYLASQVDGTLLNRFGIE